MRTIFIILGILHIWLAYKLTCNEAIVFKFTNAVCDSYNKSWFVIHKCRLRAVNRTVNTMNFNGTVLHPAHVIGVQFKLFKRANGYRPWFFDMSVDVCQFLKQEYNPVAKLVFSLFKEFTNFNHTCPYIGPQIVDGFYLRWTSLPHTIPSGDYLLALTWSFNRKPQFFTNIYFIFKEDD